MFTEPSVPGLVVEVKPAGIFYMADEKRDDEKIICVPVSDPIMNKLNDITDVNEHFKKEVEPFFQVYKDLENKKVTTNGFGDKAAAIKMIQECAERFENIENKKEELFSIRF